MFGIDVATWNTLWPSLVGVAGITVAMLWGGYKMVQLVKQGG